MAVLQNYKEFEGGNALIIDFKKVIQTLSFRGRKKFDDLFYFKIIRKVL